MGSTTFCITLPWQPRLYQLPLVVDASGLVAAPCFGHASTAACHARCCLGVLLLRLQQCPAICDRMFSSESAVARSDDEDEEVWGRRVPLLSRCRHLRASQQHLLCNQGGGWLPACRGHQRMHARLTCILGY
jgi:hypothetical protein